MKKTLFVSAILLSITLTACGGGKEKKETSETTSSSEKTSVVEKKEKKDTSKADNESKEKAAEGTADKKTEVHTGQKETKDPQVIYEALKGEWLSTENDAHDTQWMAYLTDEAAFPAPTQGVGGAFSTKISSLVWDEETQSINVQVEIYSPEGYRVPEQDFFVIIHDIDLINFSKISMSTTAFGGSDLTYVRK